MTRRATGKPPLPVLDADLFQAFDAIAAALRGQQVETRGHVAGMHPADARLIAGALRQVLTEIDTIHGND